MNDRIKSRAGTAAIAAAALMAVAAPASANLAISRTGSSAWTSANNTANVKDTASDGHSAVIKWHTRGVSDLSRLENQNGAGTTASRHASNYITSIQACVAYKFSGDACSLWKS